MSRVQDALRSGAETLETLTSKYHIKVKRHGAYPNLVMCKYNQIDSPMAEPLVQECRGIILDEADNWRIVARPFDKFFNAGEPLAAPINWKTAQVQEKLDGSLMILYHYADSWHVASSGTPDASGPVGDHGMTFKELFWKVWEQYDYNLQYLDPKLTYMFELCTPYNRVVVSHAENRLVLLGVRDRETGVEQSACAVGYYDFEVVNDFNLRNMEQLLASFEDIDGLEQEGYVVVDANFNRVKVKHPRYVLFHQMLGSLTKKKLLDAIRSGELPEVLAYFPEWKEEARVLLDAYHDFLDEALDQYQKVKDIPVQKDFAMTIKGSRHCAAMFAVRAGKSPGIADFYRTLRIDSLSDMLGLKEKGDEQVEVQA